MNRRFHSILILLCLWFNACSSLVTSQTKVPYRAMASELSCFDMMKNLTKMVPFLWRRLAPDETVARAYERHFRSLDLSEEEASWIYHQIGRIESSDYYMHRLRSGVLFSRMLSVKQRREFFEHFPGWIRFEGARSESVMKKFFKHYEKIDRYEKSIFRKEYDKLKHVPESVREARSRRVAYEKSRIYERNYVRCLAAVADPSKVTKEGLKRANTVALAITYGGAASAFLTYAATNYDLPKDEKWWGEIAFVIVTSMAVGYVNAKWILANPKLGMWTQRFPLVMGATAIQDVGVTMLWNQLLGTQPPSDEEIKQVISDPLFQQRMEEIIRFFEQEELFAGKLNDLKNLIALYDVDPFEDSDGEVDYELGSSSVETFESFEPEWINDQAARDLILQALTEYEYNAHKGPMSFGSEDYDRYIYHRGIDVIYQSSFLVASQMMYNTLCSTANPKLAVIKAISLFMAINIATDALYFVGRRGLINQ